MAVTLLRSYGGFASGATVIFSDDTEAALIAQGFAVTAGPADSLSSQSGIVQLASQGGNVAPLTLGGQTTPAFPQGPSILPNLPLGTAALTAAGASSVQVAGTMNLAEIYIPHFNVWKGLAVLNGTVVGTDNLLVALYSSSGLLVANSAVAGVLSAGASGFQKVDFVTPVALIPGRYFGGVQLNGGTATTMKAIAANGTNILTAAVAGVFGTVPATIVPPTTNTTAQGPIYQLYTV